MVEERIRRLRSNINHQACKYHLWKDRNSRLHTSTSKTVAARCCERNPAPYASETGFSRSGIYVFSNGKITRCDIRYVLVILVSVLSSLDHLHRFSTSSMAASK